jgi:hypothetical protein
MAISIPSSDIQGTNLLAAITALGSTGITSTQHTQGGGGINAKTTDRQRELMEYLIATGKISYTTFMANLSYGL